MSNDVNTRLLERADYVKTQYESTIIETAINNLITNGDLEQLEQLVSQAEGDLAREEFYGEDSC